ncbi:helix-turn-helix domain-containing protein [candidate division KSB3 bacterium]|uniref:Helix-turn-helix domain-containing protein n=1 Tax=candidate division KSB3 bacterium TaxID=2044937 RepID=A0A9D5Q7T5_9BACT|nr:helix-turn-helix domain-containing protein [candidate division KSB3 bacterium]MBD3327209.1 helix-turn-helix domain-containing protein [candidate division KSB3 bacterium]
MKSYATLVLLGVVVVATVIIIALMYQIWIAGPDDARITEAKVRTQVDNIQWYSTAYKIAFVAVLGVLLISVLLISYSVAKSRLKKAAVHTYKIGKHNEVVVHEKDLSIAAPIAMGLMNAEQLKQMNGGVERAFELYTKMAEAQAKQIQSLVGRRGVTPQPGGANISGPFQESPELPAAEGTPIPSFQELVQAREIAPGKLMILGYENGIARRGSFLDIYSAAVAGESGSGKTATLLFLIGSGLISSSIRFCGIDPHYPHPKSLGYKTKPLWEQGLMTMATYKDDMLAVLNEIERTIDRRLKQLDTDTTPVVLVIDELAFLAKTSIGGAMAHTMERISTEGRKCAVYMLASSQTWLVSRTGDSSVVRDTLTSAFVHRIKPKQANLLLQDKEEADKVKRYIKQAGDVLLCPVNDESVICRMPFTTEADMQAVAKLVGPGSIDITPQPEQHGTQTSLSETQEQKRLPDATTAPKQLSAPLEPDLLTVAILREQMEASPLGKEAWQKQLAEASGVSESLVQKILRGEKRLTKRTAKKIAPCLFPDEQSSNDKA